MSKAYIIQRINDGKYLVGFDFSTNDINKAQRFNTGPACAIKMNLDLDKRRKYRKTSFNFKSDYKMIEVK